MFQLFFNVHKRLFTISIKDFLFSFEQSLQLRHKLKMEPGFLLAFSVRICAQVYFYRHFSYAEKPLMRN